MSVELLENRRETRERDQSLESRVSALENYIAMLVGTNDIDPNIALPGTVTIGGRLCSTVASAINAAGELTASNFNTSTKIILGDFTFGASGAIKMITDVNNGLWLSPTGILGKKAGSTTFAIDILGNATFGGSLVGASGTFGTITAGSLTGLTITAGTVRTDSGDHPHAKMDSGGFEVNGQYMTIRRYDGTLGGELFASSANGLILSSFLGEQCFINGANNLVLNAGGGTLQLRHVNTTMLNTSATGVTIPTGKGITLGGVEHTTWPGSSGANTALSNVANTQVSAGLIPSSTYGLGSANQRWGELYLSGNGVGKVYFRSGSSDWASIRGDKNYIKFQSYSTICGDFALLPEQNDKMNIGSTAEYWRYVYARYIKYKSSSTSFDKYDDLQILRNLKTSGDKIDMKNMPKEVYDKKGFTDMGNLQSFNLCASKKIVECVDDLKDKLDKSNKTIKNLTNRLTKLERKII